MTRLSGDELRDGSVWNGFDYALQVWVIDAIVPRCGHPATMALQGPCCAVFSLAGRRIETIHGAERRRPTPSGGAGTSGIDHTGPRTEA